MSERAIVRRILTYLRAQPDCEVLKVHGSVYTANEPDIIGCCQGQAFVFEVKQPGEVPRPAQAARLRQWAKAGALVAAPTSLDEVQLLIQGLRERSAVLA